MGLTIDQILASLESEKTAEEVFAENLVEKKAEDPEPEVVPETETAEATPEEKPAEEVEGEEKTSEAPVETEPVELVESVEPAVTADPVVPVESEKIAEPEKTAEVELEESGRIIARGFFDELTKLSSKEEEKTASADETDEGTKIIVNLYNRYYGE